MRQTWTAPSESLILGLFQIQGHTDNVTVGAKIELVGEFCMACSRDHLDAWQWTAD